MAGSLFFYLNQEGNIYPCVFMNKKIGNLHEGSFGTIWTGDVACQIRQSVKNCSLSCWTICTAAPAIKNNPFRAARWILMTKPKAHLGSRNLL